MKPMNQAWNRSGSSSRNTRLNVSWLGTPCSNPRNFFKNSSFDRPNSAMSAQVSPPLSSVQNPITRISCSSCRFAFPVRGSSKSSKISSNSSMAPHPPLSVPFGRILPTPPAQYIFSNAIPLVLTPSSLVCRIDWPKLNVLHFEQEHRTPRRVTTEPPPEPPYPPHMSSVLGSGGDTNPFEGAASVGGLFHSSSSTDASTATTAK